MCNVAECLQYIISSTLFRKVSSCEVDVQLLQSRRESLVTFLNAAANGVTWQCFFMVLMRSCGYWTAKVTPWFLTRCCLTFKSTPREISFFDLSIQRIVTMYFSQRTPCMLECFLGWILFSNGTLKIFWSNINAAISGLFFLIYLCLPWLSWI